MKQIFTFFLILFTSGLIYGQAHEGTVEYKKSNQPAAILELPYAPDVVNDAMNDYLSKKGKSRDKSSKGFITFRNTQLTLNDSLNADLNFKVERKSRKEKQTSIISLLVTIPDGLDNTTSLHHLNMEEAKNYLNELSPVIEAYDLESQIRNQNDAVIKAESKYKSITEDGIDLEKKRVNIENKIADNKKEQELQLAEIENQKQKLAVRVSQRK